MIAEAYTRPLCPACKNPMRHSVNVEPGGASRHFVYCAVGRCASVAANDGADGTTLDAAVKKLSAAVDEEGIIFS